MLLEAFHIGVTGTESQLHFQFRLFASAYLGRLESLGPWHSRGKTDCVPKLLCSSLHVVFGEVFESADRRTLCLCVSVFISLPFKQNKSNISELPLLHLQNGIITVFFREQTKNVHGEFLGQLYSFIYKRKYDWGISFCK